MPPETYTIKTECVNCQAEGELTLQKGTVFIDGATYCDGSIQSTILPKELYYSKIPRAELLKKQIPINCENCNTPQLTRKREKYQ